MLRRILGLGQSSGHLEEQPGMIFKDFSQYTGAKCEHSRGGGPSRQWQCQLPGSPPPRAHRADRGALVPGVRRHAAGGVPHRRSPPARSRSEERRNELATFVYRLTLSYFSSTYYTRRREHATRRGGGGVARDVAGKSRRVASRRVRAQTPRRLLRLGARRRGGGARVRRGDLRRRAAAAAGSGHGLVRVRRPGAGHRRRLRVREPGRAPRKRRGFLVGTRRRARAILSGEGSSSDFS